jgi:type II secretory pathway component PulK
MKNILRITWRILMTPVGKRIPVRKGKGAPHGVALFIVLLSLSLMSAVVVDLGTQEMVRYRLASNDRDALKAQALAESAINMSRLLLAMQDAVQPMITQLAQSPFGAMLPAHTFWQIVPLDSELLKGLTSGELQSALGFDVSKSVEERKAKLEEQQKQKLAEFDAEKEGAGKEPFTPPEGGFGAFDGTFRADIQDEEQKAASLRGWRNALPQQCSAYAQRLFSVLQPERYDFLFEDRDAQGNRTDRQELVGNIYDWVDDNQEMVDPRGDLATWCRSASGAEDAVYSSGYKVEPKNAYFDSPGELRLVRGFTDAHLRAFGDQISIYADGGKVNILSAPQATIESLVFACAPPGDPLVTNPTWMSETLLGWEASKSIGVIGGGYPPTPDGFLAYLDSRGLAVTPTCKDMIGTSSNHFTVRGIAQVGEVTRTTTAVMRVYQRIEELYYYAVR